jgi:hypothetical protein
MFKSQVLNQAKNMQLEGFEVLTVLQVEPLWGNDLDMLWT